MKTKTKTSTSTDTQAGDAAPVNHEIATAVAEVINHKPADGESAAPTTTTIFSPVIVMVPTKKLKPHPTNTEVYGDESIAEDFLESVRKNGIFAPIVTTPDYVITSGHRRRKAALKLKLDEVPVIVITETDPVMIEKLILDANRQREKTNEQRAREYAKYKEIESHFALQRRDAGKASENSSEAKKGKAADIAAAEVAWSGPTAENASKVVDAIEALKKANRSNDAADLRRTLNEKSINAAVKQAKVMGAIEGKAPKAAKSKPMPSSPAFATALKKAKALVKFLESNAAKDMSKTESDELGDEITRADGLLAKI